MSDILIIPNKGSTLTPEIQFSGSVNTSASIKLQVLPEGQVAFMGKSGSLFSIVDNMSGSLMAVSDISGLPILEVFSDDRVVMGRFNSNTLVVTGTNVSVGKATANAVFDINGNTIITGSLTSTGNASVASGTITLADTTIFNCSTVNINSSTIAVGNDSTDVVGIANNSMYFNGTGNVSVGKTSPVNGKLDVNGNTFITGSAYVSGTVIDSYGMNVRSVPQNSQSTTYTLVSTDTGKHVYTNSNVTVPINVFSVGDIVTVVNNSGASISILAGSSTLRYAGTSSTGNRTLALYGICSILCIASNTYLITGTGLT